jgi:uncharacterized surface protein with fasciclin (FAS1) repeats
MNNNVHDLAHDKHATDIVNEVARRQFKRLSMAFMEASIFSPRDLSQELWAKLTAEQHRGRFLSIFVSSDESFSNYLASLCDNMVRNARRRMKDGHSVPLSALSKRDVLNLWNSSGYELEATFDDIFERQAQWG